MRLWGLDLAGCIGSCWGDPAAGLPQIEHLQLPPPGEDLGLYLSLARRWFLRRLGEIEPEEVLIERPILPKPILKTPPGARRPIIIWPTKLETTRALQGLTGMVETECFDRNISISEVQPTQAKIQLTGHGNADKPAMVRAARKAGLRITVHDEADAFAIWLYGVRCYSPRELARFDRMLWGCKPAATP